MCAPPSITISGRAKEMKKVALCDFSRTPESRLCTYIYREFGTKIQWEYDERRLKTSASNWKGGERGERAGRGGNCELLYERIL